MSDTSKTTLAQTFHKMNELRHYDNAAIEFYGKQQINCLPLNSWDRYAEHFETVLKFSKDISILQNLAEKHQWQTPLRFKEEMLEKQRVVVVTDAQLQIVHASHNMITMNGYTAAEVIGKSPKIFQGKHTSFKSKAIIAAAIHHKQAFETVVLNYRKDGSTYKCWIKAHPIFNAEKEVVHFIAYEKEVA